MRKKPPLGINQLGILIEIIGAFVIVWATFRIRKQIRHIPNTYDADLPVKLRDTVVNQAFTERTFKWDKPLTALCTVIGVILLFFQIRVMGRQTTIMERQTNISAQQTQLTERQTKIAEEQGILSHDPRLSINSPEVIRGDDKRFTLSLSNTGISDVKNIRIFRDCYVVLKRTEKHLNAWCELPPRG